MLLLPYSILGPFVGVFIDRWSRRQILVIAPLVRGALLLVTAALVVADVPDPVFYAAALGVLGSTGSSWPRSGRRSRTWCRPTG